MHVTRNDTTSHFINKDNIMNTKFDFDINPCIFFID